MLKSIATFGIAALAIAGLSANTDDRVPLSGHGSPEWYQAHRIQFHTRLSFRQRSLNASGEQDGNGRSDDLVDAFDGASSALGKMGGDVLTRHIKTGREQAPWLSGGQNRQFLQKVLDDKAASGGHVIAYLWDAGDEQIARQHPGWLCRDRRGRRQEMKRSQFLDLSSPYGQTFEGWLGEADKMGFSGAYLDANHFPRGGCYGSHLQGEFEKAGGDVRNPESWNGYAAPFLLFQADKLAQIVSGWNRNIADPDFALIVSVGQLQTLVNPLVSTDLARAGIPKTEFRTVRRDGPSLNLFRREQDLLATRPSNDARFAAGLSLLATVSGVAPHVWIHNSASRDELMRAVGSTITNGGVANVDLNEGLLAAAMKGKAAKQVNGLTPATLEPFMRLDEAISPAFDGMSLPKFAAIHYSESERNAGTLRDAWINVAGPVTRSFDILAREGVPVEVIDDRIMREGDLSQYRFIFTHDPDRLSLAQKARLRLSGTQVLALPRLPPDPAKAERDFGAALAPALVSNANPPARVSLSDPDARARVWSDRQGTYLVSIYTPSQADLQTGSAVGKGVSASPASGRGMTFSLAARGISGGGYCARELVAGQDMGRFDGRMRLRSDQPWQLFRIVPCG